MSKRTKLLIAGIATIAIPISVMAQGAKPAAKRVPAATRSGWGTLYFNSNVGSFKILGAATHKAEGHVEVSCTGTVLVSGLEGKVTQSGMREEINDRSLDKKVFFGKGHIVIDGNFSGIQFFGRDMKASWTGWGVVRLFGEFDKNLNTGEYWYAGETEHRPWMNGGMTVTVPKPKETGGAGSPIVPTIRDKG